MLRNQQPTARREPGWFSSLAPSAGLAYLHTKSGSLSSLKHFAHDIRDIVRRQPLQAASGAERLSFKPSSPDETGNVRRRGQRPVDKRPAPCG